MQKSCNHSGGYLNSAQEETNSPQVSNRSKQQLSSQQSRPHHQPQDSQSLQQNPNPINEVSQQTKLSPTTPRRVLGTIRKQPGVITQQSGKPPAKVEQQSMKKVQEKSFHKTQSTRDKKPIEEKPFIPQCPSKENPQKSIIDDNTSQRHSILNQPQRHHIGQAIKQLQKQDNHPINNYQHRQAQLLPRSQTDRSYSQSSSNQNNTTEVKEVNSREEKVYPQEVVISDQGRQTYSGCEVKSMPKSQSQQSARLCPSVTYSQQVGNLPATANFSKKQSFSVRVPSETRSQKDPQHGLQQQLQEMKQLLSKMNQKVQSQSKDIEKINTEYENLKNAKNTQNGQNDNNNKIRDRLQQLQRENQRKQKLINDMKKVNKQLLKSPNSEQSQSHKSLMTGKSSSSAKYQKPLSQFDNKFRQDDISSQSSASQYGRNSQLDRSIELSSCGSSSRSSQVVVPQRDRSRILPRQPCQTITTDLDLQQRQFLQQEQLLFTKNKNFKKKTPFPIMQAATIKDLQDTVLVSGKKKTEKKDDKKDNGKFECMEIIKEFFN